MSKPVIGVIGAIGAGKSAVAALLAGQGGAVVDADKVGHAVLEHDVVKAALAARWPEVLEDDGRVSRKAVAKIVFANPAERAFLESVVFPVIEGECRSRIAALQHDDACTFVVLDAPVLLEAGWTGIIDHLLYVDAPLPLRQERVAARSGWTPRDLAAREAHQWPADEKRRRADSVIVNDGALDELQPAVAKLVNEVLHGR